MGTYEDLAFTFRPDSDDLEDLADRLHGLLDAPVNRLPDGDWTGQ